jgi:uncharacterized protein with PIN domain
VTRLGEYSPGKRKGSAGLGGEQRSALAMPDETSQAAVSKSPQSCEKCGGALEHLTRLPKHFGSPPFDIFRCKACGRVNWIAQKATETG